jgi:hypothetical protein
MVVIFPGISDTCTISRHSPLGGGGYGSAHGEGVTGEDHTREAGHGVIYQGGIPSTPS